MSQVSDECWFVPLTTTASSKLAKGCDIEELVDLVSFALSGTSLTSMNVERLGRNESKLTFTVVHVISSSVGSFASLATWFATMFAFST